MSCHWERRVFYFVLRNLSPTINTSDLCVAGFGSNFGQDTDYTDTVSIVAVSNFKKIICVVQQDTQCGLNE